MKIDGWWNYNHVMTPTEAPHNIPNLSPIQDKSIWKADGMPILAMWISDWDCGFNTEWWHCIKDKPYEASLESKNIRYEIRKANKYFEVKHLELPSAYKEEIYNVQVSAFSAYPKEYRPTVNHESFIRDICTWDNIENMCVYGAFFKESQQLCGYCYTRKTTNSSYNLPVLKTNPQYEKYAVNAALINSLLSAIGDFLRKDGNYLTDGTRPIFHITHFQNYLEKYFKFRKAYCRLNIAINPKYYILLMILYRLRKIFYHFENIGIVHKLNSGIKLIEIAKECDKIFSQQKRST